MQYSNCPCRSQSVKGFGETKFTVSSESSSALGTNPLVTLLLGVALGAGVAGLIFSWK